MMLYRILKILLSLAIRLYYRKIKIEGDRDLLNKGPKIIIANHPNTLMDAWLIGYTCKQSIYYMAKATFFNSPLKKRFLMSLGMIPINRSTDSRTKGVTNLDSFEICYKVLEEGKTLVIFPEGNSFQDRFLRKLKSGTARIALETESRNNGKLGMKIIPVGLVYQQPDKFRSAVLVNIGTPIDPLPHIEEFRKDSLKAARVLTEEMRIGLNALLVDSEDKEQETLSDKIVRIISSSYIKGEKKGIDRDVSLLRSVNQSVHRIRMQDPDKLIEIERRVGQIEWELDQLAIKSDFLDRNYRFGLFMRQIVQSGIGLVLTFPVFLYGFIHSYLPFKLTDILVPRLVQDKEFYAAVAVLMGLILYPMTYVGFLYLSDLYIGFNWLGKLLYFITMPVTGLFAWYFYRYFKHVTVKYRFTQLMRNKEEKEVLKGLRETRNELRNLILDQPD